MAFLQPLSPAKIYFWNGGFPIQSTEEPLLRQTLSVRDFFSQGKTMRALGVNEWLFVVLSAVMTTSVIGLTIHRLVSIVEDDDSKTPALTVCILVLLNAVFCFYYSINGVLREKKFEIYSLTISLMLLLIYLIFDYLIMNDDIEDEYVHTIQLARLVATSLLAPFQIALGFVVMRRFGLLQYRIVGAFVSLQNMYRQTCVFTSVLKLDFQAACNVAVLALQNGAQLMWPQISVLAAVIGGSLLWTCIGNFAMRRESRPLMWAFLLFSPTLPAYCAFQFTATVQILTAEATSRHFLHYSQLVACIASILLRFITLPAAILVYRNFAKGLRERAFVVGIDERTPLRDSEIRGYS